MKDGSVSECGQAYAAFYCGLSAEGRAQIDELTKVREDREKALVALFPTLSGTVGELLKVTAEGRNPEVVVEAWKSHADGFDKMAASNVNLAKQVEALTNEVKDLTAQVSKKRK